MIYLDNNATTALAPEALNAMLPYLGRIYANPSSAHAAGMVVKQAVGQARAAVAGLIGVKPAEITFTASATEANHLAILGALAARPERRHLVVTAVEHPSTLLLARDLERSGYRLTIVPVDGTGRVDPGALAAAVT